MSLKLDDFISLKKSPLSFLIGFVNQMVLVPLLAWGLTILLDMDPLWSVGIILIALCPGGPTTNLITYLSKGNIALSVSLTAVNSILSIFTVPLIFALVLQSYLSETMDIYLPVSETIIKIGLVTLLPISLGMLYNNKSPISAAKLEKQVKRIAGILFVIIVLGIFFKSFHIIMESAKDLGVASLLLNIGGMCLALLLSKLFNRSEKDAIAIVLESGIQNGTLAIFIASVILQKEEIALVAGIYSVFMFITAGLVVFYTNRFIH